MQISDDYAGRLHKMQPSPQMLKKYISDDININKTW